MKPCPIVRLGEVLRRSEETMELQPDIAYRQITVKLWGKGVVLRGILTGAEIAAPRQMVARRGQFILSRIDARNGALGIVPLELDEAIVTNDFPVFNVVENRLLPTYLGWMCRTASFVEECKRASEGTTNRVRLQEDEFLAREIPLPPLAEQRRVVARIEELSAQIHEARTLRHQAAEEAEALHLSVLNQHFVGETLGGRRCRWMKRLRLTTSKLTRRSRTTRNSHISAARTWKAKPVACYLGEPQKLTELRATTTYSRREQFSTPRFVPIYAKRCSLIFAAYAAQTYIRSE